MWVRGVVSGDTVGTSTVSVVLGACSYFRPFCQRVVCTCMQVEVVWSYRLEQAMNRYSFWWDRMRIEQRIPGSDPLDLRCSGCGPRRGRPC